MSNIYIWLYEHSGATLFNRFNPFYGSFWFPSNILYIGNPGVGYLLHRKDVINRFAVLLARIFYTGSSIIGILFYIFNIPIQVLYRSLYFIVPVVFYGTVSYLYAIFKINKQILHLRQQQQQQQQQPQQQLYPPHNLVPRNAPDKSEMFTISSHVDEFYLVDCHHIFYDSHGDRTLSPFLTRTEAEDMKQFLDKKTENMSLKEISVYLRYHDPYQEWQDSKKIISRDGFCDIVIKTY